jgi:hypothetical protein
MAKERTRTREPEERTSELTFRQANTVRGETDRMLTERLREFGYTAQEARHLVRLARRGGEARDWVEEHDIDQVRKLREIMNKVEEGLLSPIEMGEGQTVADARRDRLDEVRSDLAWRIGATTFHREREFGGEIEQAAAEETAEQESAEAVAQTFYYDVTIGDDTYRIRSAELPTTGSVSSVTSEAARRLYAAIRSSATELYVVNEDGSTTRLSDAQLSAFKRNIVRHARRAGGLSVSRAMA